MCECSFATGTTRGRLREKSIMIPSTIPSKRLWAVWSLLVISIGPLVPVAAAQSASMPRPGEQVRGRIIQPATAALGAECTGAVRAVEHDTVIVASSDGCPRDSELGDLRVARGNRGSRLTHVGLGILVGGITGAVVARNTGRGRCADSGCVGDDYGYVSGIRTTVYSAIGIAIGAGIGAALPAGPRWIRIASDKPVRVVGIAVHPEVRVSLRHRISQ